MFVSHKVMHSARFQSSISQLHLIHHLTLVPHLTAPFDHSIQTIYEKVLEREPIRSACRLKTHVIPDVVVVVYQNLNLMSEQNQLGMA